MKKLLLGLGAVTATVAPIAAVVACGDDDKTIAVPTMKNGNLVTTFNINHVDFGEYQTTPKNNDLLTAAKLFKEGLEHEGVSSVKVTLTNGTTALETATIAFDDSTKAINGLEAYLKGSNIVFTNGKLTLKTGQTIKTVKAEYVLRIIFALKTGLTLYGTANPAIIGVDVKGNVVPDTSIINKGKQTAAHKQ